MKTDWNILNLEHQNKRLVLSCTFSADDLTVNQTGGFSIIGLKNGIRQALPGQPDVPAVLVQLALPEGLEVTATHIKDAAQHQIAGTHYLFPAQPPFLRGVDYKSRFEVLKDIDRTSFPKSPAYVGPEANIYQQKSLYPAQVATPCPVMAIGSYRVLPVLLFPVQYLPHDNALFATTRFNVEFELSPLAAKQTPAAPPDPALQQNWYQQAAAIVINPQLLTSPQLLHDRLQTTYLILTNATMKPEFDRLARWKRALGWQTRVVTIEEVTSGHYGDFSSGSAGSVRDLQEQIRNFLKWARREWAVSNLLIGGDVDVIPVRLVAGISLDDWHFFPPNPTDPDPSYGCHRVGNETWVDTRDPMEDPDTAHPGSVPVLGIDSGREIPYKPGAGDYESAWHYTDSSYTPLSTTPTQYIVITGPYSLDTTGFATINPDCMVPTDMYYSNLVSPLYDQPGLHDWDALNQNLYGYGNYQDVSGVDYTPSVAVGRFPCSTVDEARTLISKALKYEHYQQMDDVSMASAIFAADYLDYPPSASKTTNYPPGNNQFYVDGTCTLICMEEIPHSPINLILEQNADTWIPVPYNPNANEFGHTTFGWYFATGPASTDVSALNGVPVPTHYIVVWNPNPGQQSVYWLDPASLDSTAEEKEHVRSIFRGEDPGISMHHLVYRDARSAPASTPADPLTVEFLNKANIVGAFNRGSAFASLSSHGLPNGCCQMGIENVTGLTNGLNLPVVFANSCLTNYFVADDCLGEYFVLNPSGGAIAYCGFTRDAYSGSEVMENFFWTTLLNDSANGGKTIGEAMTARQQYLSSLSGRAGCQEKFMVAALNLCGDPALRPWMSPPQRLVLTASFELKKPYVHVKTAAGAAVDHVFITIADPDNVVFSGTTDLFGNLVFPMEAIKNILHTPANALAGVTCEITASKRGYAPAQIEVNSHSNGVLNSFNPPFTPHG